MSTHPSQVRFDDVRPVINQPGPPTQAAPGINNVVMVQQTQYLNPGWQTDLCDCCEDGEICAVGYFCSHFMACANAARIDKDCCYGCCCPCAVRTDIRERYNIDGDECHDLLLGFFCYTLTTCQIARELKAREGPGTICCC